MKINLRTMKVLLAQSRKEGNFEVMRQSRKQNFKHVLIQFFAPYAIFVLIPVIVLAIISEKAISITRQNAIRDQLTVTNQGKYYIDTIIQTIDIIAPQIQMNTDIVELQKLPEKRETPDYFDIWKANKTLQKLYSTGYDIRTCIYYTQSSVLLSPSFTCNDLRQDYGGRYLFGNRSFEQFLEEYPIKDYRKVFYPWNTYLWNGQAAAGLLYGRPLTAQCQATIFFMIEDLDIQNGFVSLLENGSLYILDEHNQLLAAYGQALPEDFAFPTLSSLEPQGQLPDNLFGTHSVSTYVISDYGLRYIAVIPEAIVYREVKYLRYLSIGMNITAILIAAGYGLFLAFRSSSRISPLLESTNNAHLPQYTGGNVFDYLNNSMLSLLNSNRSLQLSVQEQQPILRAAYLDKLVNDSFSGEKERLELQRKLSLEFDGKWFCVLAVFLEKTNIDYSVQSMDSLEEIEEFAAQKQQLLLLLEQAFEKRGYIYSRNIDQIVILCCFTPQEAQYYQRICTPLIQQSIDAVPSSTLIVRCVGSETFEDIRQVYESCNLCRDLLRQSTYADYQGGVLWNHDHPRGQPDPHVFYYPPDFEARLLYQLKAGQGGNAAESVNMLFYKNFSQLQLRPQMQRLLISQLKITLLKALDGDEMLSAYEERILHLNVNRSYDVLCQHCVALVQDISKTYAGRSGRKASELKREMVAFVEENYANPELSLKYVSAKYHLSEAYFSQLFKELAGENFSTYLDKIRMRQANLLLQDKNIRIDDIARSCGYSTTSTFRRAYKRFYGISPSQSRGL